ncbi:MAG TPA: GNAT family N-acetyltransferase [Patescibacteria group bacterium]|jgi:RimJ/RimL family protein N-acetyltransferase|nr:GNAT family N-acetyltransferase [Patescibacteria group bacterium]
MKEGTVYREFSAKDGLDVTLRAPRWSDLDDLLLFINALVLEGAEITRDAVTTRNEEASWLSRHLVAVERDKRAAVVAEVDGHCVGQLEVEPGKGYCSHVGGVTVALRDGYRDVGIGSEMMAEADVQAKRLGLELLTLEVNETNARARHVFEKSGFAEVGRVPRAVKMKGMYIDHIIMAREL